MGLLLACLAAAKKEKKNQVEVGGGMEIEGQTVKRYLRAEAQCTVEDSRLEVSPRKSLLVTSRIPNVSKTTKPGGRPQRDANVVATVRGTQTGDPSVPAGGMRPSLSCEPIPRCPNTVGRRRRNSHCRRGDGVTFLREAPRWRPIDRTTFVPEERPTDKKIHRRTKTGVPVGCQLSVSSGNLQRKGLG